jgi:hypothetical protein
MKTLPFPILCFATLLLTGWLAGCATRRIDWGSRVGSYTFDQAIVEIGPPDKQAKLTDGTLVAEWLTRRGYHQIYAGGFYRSSSYYEPYPLHYVDAYSPDFFLRLTFGADGRLQSWKQYAK